MAVSLSLLPACAASINLQQLGSPSGAAAEEGGEKGGAEGGELLPAAAAGPAARATSSLVAAAAAAVPAGGGSSGGHATLHAKFVPPTAGAPQLAGSQHEEEVGREEEAGGLSAYLSSWFSSPTKAPKPALPSSAAAGIGLAAAVQVAAEGSSAPRSQQPSPAVQVLGASSPPRRLPGLAAGPGSVQAAAAAACSGAAGAQATATAVDIPAAGPGSGAAAAAATARAGAGAGAGGSEGRGARLLGLLAQLEERLAAVLPSAGVVHLGLPLTPEGAVLRWRQQLRVVAEPSEWGLCVLWSTTGQEEMVG